MKGLLALATLLVVPVWAGSMPEDSLDELRDRLAPFGSSCLEGDEACGGGRGGGPGGSDGSDRRTAVGSGGL